MFKKNDPLVDSVKAVMEVSDIDRQIEAAVNEEFGVTSKNALPHELKPAYEEMIAEVKKCMYEGGAEGSIPKTPKEKDLAKKHGNPNRITKGDVLKARGVIEEDDLDEKWKEELEEEQLDEISQKKVIDTLKLHGPEPYGHPKNDAILKHMRKKWGKKSVKNAETALDTAYWGRGHESDYATENDPLEFSSQREKRYKKSGELDKRSVEGLKKAHRRAIEDMTDKRAPRGVPKAKLPEETEQLDEISKEKLGRYIKAAKKDSSEKSFLQGFDRAISARAESETEREHTKGGMSKRSEEMKKRSHGISKAVDKLTGQAKVHAKEETLDEKAVSKAQHRFFGLVRGIQKGKAHGSEKAEKAAKEMSVKSVRDYAKTKEAGLPEKKKKMDEQTLWEEIKSNLEEQLVSVYESGDEAAFAAFVGGLTEEQLAILGLNEAGIMGMASQAADAIKSGVSAAAGKVKELGTAVSQKLSGTAGTGADPRAASAPSSIPTSGAERGDYNKPSHLGAGSAAQTQVASAAAPKAPDLSGGRTSVSKGSVDKPGAIYQTQSSGKLALQNKPASTGMPSARPPGMMGLGGPKPTGAIPRPGMRSGMPARRPSYGAAAAGDVGSSLSGSQALREETKPQIKESFEHFLRNKFLKG